MNRLNIADWNLSKVIISNRDRKFFFDFWRAVFNKLDVRLLYFIVYHAQTNEQSKIFNQIVEIALRFYLVIMKNSINWSEILLKMQRHINNSQSIVTSKTSNETTYDFTSIQSLNFWKSFVVVEDLAVDLKESFVVEVRKFFTNAFFSAADRVKIEIADFIVFVQMNAKYYYDRKHQFMFMKIDDYAHIRLHHDYDISFTTILNKKLSQQYVSFFKILKKIKRLTYRLNLLSHWRIHFVLSITQLKSTTSSNENFFRRLRSNQSEFVYVNDDIARVKSWEIDRLLNKRQIKRRDSKYLVRWREYGLEYDEWRNLSKLENVAELVQEYEDVVKAITSLPGRLLPKPSANQEPHAAAPRKMKLLAGPTTIPATKPSAVSGTKPLAAPSVPSDSQKAATSAKSPAPSEKPSSALVPAGKPFAVVIPPPAGKPISTALVRR